MEEKHLICIGCPMGCPITVAMEGGEIKSITGFTCKRGETYARKEVTHPTRIVTTTVQVAGGTAPVVSVKTAGDIPKEKVFACADALRRLRIEAPVAMGDVVLADAAGTGVDVVATRAVAAVPGKQAGLPPRLHIL